MASNQNDVVEFEPDEAMRKALEKTGVVEVLPDGSLKVLPSYYERHPERRPKLQPDPL